MNTILESLRSGAPLAKRQAIINRATRGPLIRDKTHGVTRTSRSIPIDGCELASIDVSGLNLSRVPISKGVLRDGTCIGTRFAHLSEFLLEDVTAIGATFLRLSGCKIVRADCRNADFGPLVTGCSFKDSTLAGAHFGQVTSDRCLETQQSVFEHCDMSNCQATASNLSGSRLLATRLANARLTRCILRDCELTDTDLCGANLLGAVIDRTKLAGVNFRDAILSAKEATALRELGASARKARIVSIHESDAFQELAIKLATSRDYLLKWNMLSDQGGCDRITVYADDMASPLAGAMAFKRPLVCDGAAMSTECEYHDSYTIDGARDIAKIFRDIACDYVGWRADLCSLRVSDVDDRVLPGVEALARDALTELTNAVSA